MRFKLVFPNHPGVYTVIEAEDLESAKNILKNYFIEALYLEVSIPKKETE